MSETSLYLFHTVPDARLLAAWVARHQPRNAPQSGDLGDAFHGLLHAAFDSVAPQPFRYLDGRRGLLAYTPLDADAMRQQVALADPLAAQTLGLGANGSHDGYRLRPFPTRWPKGALLGFEVRLRPVLRTAKGERDAFQHAWDQSPHEPPERQKVYVQWLREHLAQREGSAQESWQGAVELLDDVHLVGFQRQQVVRRSRAASRETRFRRLCDGPDALVKGHLRVRDPGAFAQLLARGVGRHRAFGFGMLLLSRPI